MDNSVVPRRSVREVLLVEDNPADIQLTRETLSDCSFSGNLHVARDGIEAMTFLNREGECAGKPRPDLIILDLNLPKKDGREVLQEIKDDASLRRIPVIVLTTSQAEPDIVKSYNLHVNCYITKPFDFEKFSEIMHSIEHFWLNVVVLPAT